MRSILRASLSLDGKLLTASGKPSLRVIPIDRIRVADELVLTIHPVIVGDDSVPTLTGFAETFLTRELKWELVSSASGRSGTILTRYRRKTVKAKPASRRSRAAV